MTNDIPKPDVIQIPLTQDLFTIVDAIDGDLLAFKWCANSRNNQCYALRSIWIEPNNKTIYMHRTILERVVGRPLERYELCDHIDGNGLNNTRLNLRLSTQAQNLSNRGKQSNNTSGYKGVSWNKSNRNWNACIRVNRKTIYLGSFDLIEDAARAYNEAAVKYHGGFSSLNEMPVEVK